jgi:hypothetical protein
MDPREDIDPIGSVDCAACGVPVPTERIRVLAQREDIAFVEIQCPACRSESLGILIASEDEAPDDDPSVAVGPGRPWGEFGPDDVDRFRDAAPIGDRDVQLVHELLARGGLGALVSGGEPPSAGSTR